MNIDAMVVQDGNVTGCDGGRAVPFIWHQFAPALDHMFE